MPKYVIEREIPGAGKLSHEQLQAISQKSCGVMRNFGPQISMGRKLRDGRSGLLRLHRGQRGTDSRTRPAGRFSREPDFRGPRDYRSDHRRIAVALNLTKTQPIKRCRHRRETGSFPRSSYCRARRRNKNTPSTINRTFGNQTSSSGCACGFPRNVSPTITNRK